MKTSGEVRSYYEKLWNEYETNKENIPNLRHRKIFYELKKLGLKKGSKVLEIGCGNGVLTKLIADYTRKGLVVGVDISVETIEFLKNKFQSKNNVQFISSDMSNFKYNSSFDFIVFPDVLEHIPIESHSNIFRNVRNICHDKTIIFINIPEPNYLEWTIKYKPETIQIIDQPLFLYPFSKAIYENGFYIESVNSYSLWVNVNDYQAIVVKLRINYKLVKSISWFKNLIKRIFYRIINMI